MPDIYTPIDKTSIRSFDGSFKVLLDTKIRKEWDYSILGYFTSLQHYAQMFTVVIDKEQHKAKYPDETFDPYHYSLEVLLWRVRGYLVASRSDSCSNRNGYIFIGCIDIFSWQYAKCDPATLNSAFAGGFHDTAPPTAD